MKRTILHCDLNSFFASVEIFLNPELKGKPVAVCGSVEDRHGIVLAKSDEAKAYGVATAEAVWQAKQKCPDLIIVPPHFDRYMEFSKKAKAVYSRYTDLIEPFGMDECWLDVTGSRRLFGDGMTIAEDIRQRMKAEVGLSVSIGVSFNKIFAKLGSDMKKPDAITAIPYESFRNQLKDVPASDMLGVGRKTGAVLKRYCINTIGELAATNPDFLRRRLGKGGEQIWRWANGYDNSPVSALNYEAPIKSIGHGTTCSADLVSNEEVKAVFIRLSQDIGKKLRRHNLSASAVQITIRDKNLIIKQFQTRLGYFTQNFTDIYENAYRLFLKSYDWHDSIRSLTVRAINLSEGARPEQLDLMADFERRDKVAAAEIAMEKIRGRFGHNAVDMAVLMTNTKTAPELMPSLLPGSVR